MEKSILTELFIVLTHPPSQPLFANIWLGNFWPARVAELSVWYLREFGKLVNSWSYITTNSQQPLDWIDSDMERLTVLLRLLSHQVFFLWRCCRMYWCNTLPRVRTDCEHKPRNRGVMSNKMEVRAEGGGEVLPTGRRGEELNYTSLWDCSFSMVLHGRHLLKDFHLNTT